MHFDSFLRQSMRTFRLFLLAQQKEELCCSETVVEAFIGCSERRVTRIYTVLELLQSIDDGKSAGSDGIPQCILKNT